MNDFIDPTLAERSVKRAYNMQLSLFEWLDEYHRRLDKAIDRAVYSEEFDINIVYSALRSCRFNAAKYSINQAFYRLNNTKYQLKHFEEFKYYYDKGMCWACGEIVGKELLEAGHLVDRVCGGEDLWSNKRPMCITCNRLFKKPS